MREELIMACLPYVKSSAHHLSMYAPPYQDAGDLINAGVIGLMDALERYDPAKGASFKNYAKYRVRGSIMDEIRSMDWVPYSTREKARKIGTAMKELEQNRNEAPNDEDMAEAIGISLEKYRETLLEVNRMTLSFLEETFYNGEIFSTSGDTDVRDPEAEIINAETKTVVGNAINNLPKKERLVVTLYYYEEMTMKEIGEVLNVSESRVCQIHANAVLRLHTRLNTSASVYRVGTINNTIVKSVNHY